LGGGSRCFCHIKATTYINNTFSKQSEKQAPAIQVLL